MMSPMSTDGMNLYDDKSNTDIQKDYFFNLQQIYKEHAMEN
jgi:hypothetical protein